MMNMNYTPKRRYGSFVLGEDGPLTAEYFDVLPQTIYLDFGGGTGDAQDAIVAGQQQSIRALQDMYEQARTDIAPWRVAGGGGTEKDWSKVGGAVGQIAGLLNIPGATALDPTKTLTATPGYQFLQDQGTQALARYGAATGLGLSGAGAKSALDYGQNLALTKAWGPYMSALQGLSGQGLQGATSSGNWAMQTGQAEAGVYSNTANQLAQLKLQEAQNQNSFWNDIMSGVGMAGSLALAPFTGGTSAFGGLLGGGGGSYANSLPALMGGSGYGGISVAQYMADGGPTSAAQPYIVGERGPELFIPQTSGYVVPNHALSSSPAIADYTVFAPWRN